MTSTFIIKFRQFANQMRIKQEPYRLGYTQIKAIVNLTLGSMQYATGYALKLKDKNHSLARKHICMGEQALSKGIKDLFADRVVGAAIVGAGVALFSYKLAYSE